MLLLSIFTPIYEMLVGTNQESPEYRDGIFSSVGIISIIASIATCLLFYIALGRWKPVFHKIIHWTITLSVTALTGFYLAYALANKEIGGIDAYALRFAFINALYAGVYFSMLSLLLKRVSIFAKHTPF